MKTKILKLTVIMLLMAGSFSACKEKGNDNSKSALKAYSTTEGRFNINENEYVSMRVLPEKVFINSEIKIKIENHTSRYTLGYGYDFFLEYFDNENWTLIQLNYNFIPVGLGLKPYEITEQQILLSGLPEQYLNRLGKYRIIKNVWLYSVFPPYEIDSIFGSFNLYAEFEIIQNY